MAALCLGLAVLAATAVGQGRPAIIEGATLLTADGKEIPRAGVAWSGGKITAVGPKASGGFLARKIDGKDKYVTPGLIDVWAMAPLAQTPAGGLAGGRGLDLIDTYAEADRTIAWQHGILAAYVPAVAAGGAAGQGAVVRFAPRVDEESVVLSETASVCFVIGARDESPLARVQQLQAMRAAFREARDLRDAREDYDEELKEYEKKLTEAAKNRPASQPATASAAAKEGGKPERRGRGGGERGGAESKPASEKESQGGRAKTDGPKKPTEPLRDANKSVLIRALEGEIVVRVWVERPEDIRGVLDIADEFGLALVLEGASGAPLVADEIKKAGAAVVLSVGTSQMQFDPGSRRFEAVDGVARLSRAGVRVFVGSGSSAGSDLALGASRAVGYGADGATAWKRLTGEAAEMLGLSKKVGQLKTGDAADFVLWSGHPFAPGTHVERVFIGGKEVYNTQGGAVQ